MKRKGFLIKYNFFINLLPSEFKQLQNISARYPQRKMISEVIFKDVLNIIKFAVFEIIQELEAA